MSAPPAAARNRRRLKGVANPRGVDYGDGPELAKLSKERLKKLEFEGLPFLIEHRKGSDAGTIEAAWVSDADGRLHLTGFLDMDTANGREAARGIESGLYKEMSVGYGADMRKRADGRLEMTNHRAKEVSLVELGDRHSTAVEWLERASAGNPYTSGATAVSVSASGSADTAQLLFRIELEASGSAPAAMSANDTPTTAAKADAPAESNAEMAAELARLRKYKADHEKAKAGEEQQKQAQLEQALEESRLQAEQERKKVELLEARAAKADEYERAERDKADAAERERLEKGGAIELMRQALMRKGLSEDEARAEACKTAAMLVENRDQPQYRELLASAGEVAQLTQTQLHELMVKHNAEVEAKAALDAERAELARELEAARAKEADTYATIEALASQARTYGSSSALNALLMKLGKPVATTKTAPAQPERKLHGAAAEAVARKQQQQQVEKPKNDPMDVWTRPNSAPAQQQVTPPAAAGAPQGVTMESLQSMTQEQKNELLQRMVAGQTANAAPQVPQQQQQAVPTQGFQPQGQYAYQGMPAQPGAPQNGMIGGQPSLIEQQQRLAQLQQHILQEQYKLRLQAAGVYGAGAGSSSMGGEQSTAPFYTTNQTFNPDPRLIKREDEKPYDGPTMQLPPGIEAPLEGGGEKYANRANFDRMMAAVNRMDSNLLYNKSQRPIAVTASAVGDRLDLKPRNFELVTRDKGFFG